MSPYFDDVSRVPNTTDIPGTFVSYFEFPSTMGTIDNVHMDADIFDDGVLVSMLPNLLIFRLASDTGDLAIESLEIYNQPNCVEGDTEPLYKIYSKSMSMWPIANLNDNENCYIYDEERKIKVFYLS